MQTLVSSVVKMLESVPGIFTPEAIADFDTAARRVLQHTAAALDLRARSGCTRRCHGDLHLGNIVMWHGKPTLFDALEFDEALATIDPLYDLAFLLMDLDFRRHRRAANIVLNRYLWHSTSDLNLSGLRALPLFLGLRAAIRAGVAAERAVQQSSPSDNGDAAVARAYLRTASSYLTPQAARLVAIGGLSGTGKTTLARSLACHIDPAPGAVHLRSDLERKLLYGVSETTRLSVDSYSADASHKVYEILKTKTRAVLEAGHSVVLDAVHARAEERQQIEAIASKLGVRFAGLWLIAEPQHLLDRVSRRQADASDATPEVVCEQLKWDVEQLTCGWTKIEASGSADRTLEQALKVLHFDKAESTASGSIKADTDDAQPRT
jgi:predicted kinase